MKSFLHTSLLALSVAALGQGAVIIDQFNGPLNLAIPALGANPASVSGGNANANIIGGNRGVIFTRTGGNGAEQLNIDLGGSGILEFASGAFDTVSAFLQWDGDTNANVFNPLGLGGVDLTEGGINDRITIGQHADRPTVATNFATIQLTVYTDAGNASRLTINSVNTSFLGPFLDLDFSFAAFTTILGAGANFANVGAIDLLVSGTQAPGLDFALDFIEAREIPEPTSLLLVGGALLGAGLIRRRRSA